MWRRLMSSAGCLPRAVSRACELRNARLCRSNNGATGIEVPVGHLFMTQDRRFPFEQWKRFVVDGTLCPFSIKAGYVCLRRVQETNDRRLIANRIWAVVDPQETCRRSR